MTRNLILLTTLVKLTVSAVCTGNQLRVVKPGNGTVQEDSLVNIKLNYNPSSMQDVGKLKVVFGTCGDASQDTTIGETNYLPHKPNKFVWLTPQKDTPRPKADVCVKVLSGNCVLGKSHPFKIVPSQFDYLDEDNSWRYDAVKDFKSAPNFVANQASKSVGIVGGGMSGMFSALLLESLNLNYKIELIESNEERVGGRIWTYHFPQGDRYDYHELGAMRLIKNWTYANGTEAEDKSSRSVFRLLTYLNNTITNPKDKLKLIPFVFGKTQDGHFGTFSGWQQLEDGLDRLPKALRNELVNLKVKITHGKVYKLNFTATDNQVELKYKPRLVVNTPDVATKHDYAIVAVPLTVARFWKLPKFSKDLTDLIHFQHHDRTCKVLLKFEQRFWNSTEYVGQQLSDNSTTLFTTVYPSHGNSKVIIASYVYTDRLETQEAAGIDEMEMLAIDELTKIHGEVVRHSYKKGNIKRQCWHLDPNSLNGFVYFNYLHEKEKQLPAFSKMQFNTVFTVDSTDHRASWIGGALNAGLRGVLQVLIKDGHVDEARALKDKWGGDYHHI